MKHSESLRDAGRICIPDLAEIHDGDYYFTSGRTQYAYVGKLKLNLKNSKFFSTKEMNVWYLDRPRK